MKKLVSLLFAGALIVGAYVVSFGLPASLSGLMPGASEPVVDSAGPAARGGRPGGRPGGGATTVVVEPLKQEPYTDILRAIGSTVAQRSVNVVATVSGEVTESFIEANTEVAAGDILLELDNETEILNLEIAQAELDQAQQTVERYKSLLTNADVTAVDVADANVAARLAEAAVGLAQIALEDRTIRAPIDGRLGLSDVEVGDRVSAEQVLVTIDDTETLLIEFELPERSISLLEKGRAVLANTPVFTGRTFEGEIVAFDSRLDSVTRSVTVRAQIDNPDRKLWSGMTFAIRLINEIEKLPAVPATAITWSRAGSAVWTNTDGVAARVPVTILYREGDRVWIETDIAEGSSIVTEGAQKLREGGVLLVDGADRKPRSEEPA